MNFIRRQHIFAIILHLVIIALLMSNLLAHGGRPVQGQLGMALLCGYNAWVDRKAHRWLALLCLAGTVLSLAALLTL